MKISWIILTFNRMGTVKHAVTHNLAYAGREPDEIIWVDNGSSDQMLEFAKEIKPDVLIANKQNLGVAKGYNRGLALATGDYLVITGCDRLMPENWLATWVKYLENIPQTGIISCYTAPLEQVPERRRGETTIHMKSVLPYIPAMPFEARIIPKSLHQKAGYLLESLGLYGWEDNAWAERVEKLTRDQGLINYIIPGMTAHHLGCEGISDWNGRDEADYHSFKMKEARDPNKQKIIEQYRKDHHPYFNPYM